ncbi:hypothetical protein Sjap_017033 [Stephania japonica]|uniref:Uncharacterized protein n=1 Tax=Stephania japonica TaxID=461633 RepID=A0AAP0I5F1_9MAGN
MLSGFYLVKRKIDIIYSIEAKSMINDNRTLWAVFWIFGICRSQTGVFFYGTRSAVRDVELGSLRSILVCTSTTP